MNRKHYPIYSGLAKYFPDAMYEASHVSFIGNEQHNPGEPLHWDRDKSTDDLDALARHLIDHARGDKFDTDGGRLLAKVMWRAGAALQKEIEAERKGVLESDGGPDDKYMGLMRDTD